MHHILVTLTTLVETDMEFPIFLNGVQDGTITFELVDLGQRQFQIQIVDGPLVGDCFEDWDYFSALSKLRLKLEEKGLLLGCIGSLENFYPSNMSLDMGLGKVGYLMEMGEKSGRSSQARVFDICYDVQKLASVESQKKYFQMWKDSLESQL